MPENTHGGRFDFRTSTVHFSLADTVVHVRSIKSRIEPTEDNDIKDQDDQSKNTAASAVGPSVVDGSSGQGLVCERGSEAKRSQAELEDKARDQNVLHLGDD